MAQSVVGIYNMALANLGANTVTAVSDNTKGANTCGVFYDSVRDDALASYAWQFATTQAALAKDATAPTFGYEYRYALPAGCLKVMRMSDDTQKYRVQGGYLHTDLNSDDADVEIEYVQQVTDVTLFSPAFYSALGYGLAAKIAVALLGAQKGGKMADMMEGRFRVALDDAMSNDALQWKEDLDVDTATNFPWIAARG